MFWHKELKVLLTVYVDDFKMAGPRQAVSRAWGLVGSKLKLESPKAANRYLGCDHIRTAIKATDGFDPRHAPVDGVHVKKSKPDFLLAPDKKVGLPTGGRHDKGRSQKDYEEHTWERIVKTGRKFQTTSTGGPEWDSVVIRDTFSLKDNSLILSEDVGT